ncbi:MAG: hypothetical protein ABJB69_03780 [Spartobacteria bacterium]
MSRVYPLLGFCGGYALLMWCNPVRQAMRDGLRCVARYKRIWLAFVLLGLGYSVFQFATFSQIESSADFDLNQVASLPNWHWPKLADVWTQVPLPTLEGVAGIFDNATTTYPLSVIAAILLLMNWRGLHGGLLRALRKRYHFASHIIYLILLIGALASLGKPIVFWWLPHAGNSIPEARVLQISASVDAIAFIFEYLLGVYIQVYLITVCLVWVKGLSFNEESLFQFALRRFTYVLKWAGVVVLVSTLLVRVPLLLAYFMRVPDVLDYLPLQRVFMSILIIAFASVQVSLALHNENLREAIAAHARFVRQNLGHFGWFLLICAMHFFFIMACDAIARDAIADRIVALIIWKCFFVTVRGLVAGWLLASWVCLFRRCERGRLEQESWIRY